MEEEKQEDLWSINFEDIEVAEEIGRGQFGCVYHGTLFGSDVAVKKIFRLEEADRKYMEREHALLRTLAHPNIVQFIGLCAHDGAAWLVSEYCSRGNLSKCLYDASVVLKWSQRVHYALDCIQAVAFLHSKGLMHRDLKSENLLLDDRDRVKLCDFGFARKIDKKLEQIQKGKKGAAAAMTIAGTDEWMAPEVIVGVPYGQPADIFSFGICLTEIILRKKPEERHPRSAFEFEVQEFQSGVPADCPPEFSSLVLSCCEYEPKKRPEAKVIVKGLKELHKLVADKEKSAAAAVVVPAVAIPPPPPAVAVEPPPEQKQVEEVQPSPNRSPRPGSGMPKPVSLGPYVGFQPTDEDQACASLYPAENDVCRNFPLVSAPGKGQSSRAHWVFFQDAVAAKGVQGWQKTSFGSEKKEHKFFYVLFQDCLYYWKNNKKGERNIGRILLDSTCKVQMSETGKKKASLSITNWKGESATMHGSVEELQKWNAALAEVQQNATLSLEEAFGPSKVPHGRSLITTDPGTSAYPMRMAGYKPAVLFCVCRGFGVRILSAFLEDVLLDIPWEVLPKWQIERNETLELMVTIGPKKLHALSFTCLAWVLAAEVFTALENTSKGENTPQLQAISPKQLKRSSVAAK